MKSTKRFISLTVLIILLAAGLTSCGNLLMAGIDEKGETAVSGQASTGGKAAIGSISGSVTAEGALPAQLVRRPASSARTAFPNNDFSSEDYIYTAKLLQSNTVKQTTEFDGTSYSFGNLDNGTYTISVEVTKGEKVVLSGSSGTITISDETPSVTLDPLLLEPGTTGTGNINLRVNSESSDVKKVDAWLVTNNDTISETFTFSEGHADIVFTNVKAYSLTLEFYKEVAYGNETRQVLAYQCKEVVNVFDNMTTDTWVKNGGERYLVKDTESGTATFKLTEDLLKDFEMNTYYVDSSLTDGRNNGSPFDPFHTLEQAVVAVSSSNTSAAKTILIKAGTTVSEPGATLTVMESKGALSIGVYGAEGGTTTATVKKTRNSTFATVVQNASFSVSNINFINTDGISLTTCATWVEIQSGATGTFENCTFSGSTGNNSIYTAAENTTVKNCTFQGDANSVYCSAGSKLHLNGDAHHFTDGSEIVLDSTDTTRAGIYIDSEFNANSHSEETIPVRFITPSRYVNNNVFFQNIIDNLVAFTVTGPDFDNYEIDSNGKLQLKALSVYIKLSDESDPIEKDSFDDALSAAKEAGIGNNCTIYLPNGSEHTSSTSFISTCNISIEPYASEPGDYDTVATKPRTTIKLTTVLRLWNDYTFEAKGINFVGSGTESEDGGLIFVQSNGDVYDATFTDCSFSNGKASEYGGAIYNQGKLTLENCSFSNNTMHDNTANDIVTWCSKQLLLKGQNTFSGPICCNKQKNSPVSIRVSNINRSDNTTPYATLAFFDWITDGYKWIESGYQIIEGLEDGQESWFPCSESDYFIDSYGKLQKYSESTTLYVGSNGSDSESGYGYSASKPFATLQHALSLCDTAKTIWVAKDGSEVVSNGDWSVYGKNADIKVTDDGTYTLTFSGSSTHMLISDSSEISLTGIEFTRSDTLNGGGSFIYSTGSSSVTCTSCSFTTNSKASTGEGGAIFNDANLSLNNCSFNNCSSEKTGGAIYNGSNGTLTLSDCTFSGNTASSVSNDIYHTGSSVTLKAGNIFGGGIKLESGKMLTITEALDVGDGTIKITPPSYTVGTQILDGDYMSYALSHNLIVLDNTLYEIDSNGTLQVKSTEPVVSITDYASEADPLSSLYSNYKGNTQKLIITIPENGTLASKGHTLSTIPTVTIQPADNHSATITFAGGAKTFYIGNNGMTNFNFNNITFERTDDSSGLFVSSYSGLTVTYKGCTFKDGKSDEGVIYVNADSEHIFENCNFTNNSPRAITIAAFGKLTLKGANSFGENDTIEILRNYQYKISLEAESVVKSGSTVKIYTESFPAIEGKQIFEGTYVSQAATFECTDPDYCFDSDGYCRKR